MNKKVKNIISICIFTVLCLNLQAQIFDADTLHFCKQDSVMLDAGTGYNSYYWNTGETSQSIWAKRSAWYFVEAISTSGTILDSILIDLNRSRIEQNDTLVCYGADFTLSVSNTEPNTLIGDYRFDNGSYKDYSGNKHDAFSPISMLTVTDRHGMEDMALYFSPTSTSPSNLSCLQIPYNPLFDISQSFTLHCWINPDTIFGLNAPNEMFYLINRWKPVDGDYSNCSYSLALTKDGHVHFLTSDGTNQQHFQTSGDALIFPDQWAMIDIVCSMRKIKIYVNAQLKVTSDITAFPQALNMVDTYLGASYSLQNHNYQGFMDDVKIYASDLSTQEIINLYNGNTTYGYDYKWSNGETTREIIINPTEDKEYSVIISNNIASCYDTINISVYPEFNVKITQVKKGCPDTNEGALLVNASGGITFDENSDLPYTYIWPRGYEHYAKDSIIYRLPAGSYDVSVVDSVGCTIKNTIPVETYPRLEIEIISDPEQVYPQNPIVYLSTTTACDTCYIYDYLWKIVYKDALTGNINKTDQSKEIEFSYNFGPFEEKEYVEFLIMNYQTYEAECVDSATLVIPVAKPVLKIPNAFTPNSDGINDTFDITVDGDERTILDIFTGNTLSIYNRQGFLVYSKNDYSGSPGEFDGKNLPDGVYFYVLNCKGVRSNETYQGYVHIFRNAPKERD
ncbi:gliding motility-associated C-terminal domain-containing protein [Bacteroidales bacterium OttesenSCG-928-K03]|nr:gliding motility-associated C-terminal domain-containing protein [Odoribacter sp. OttesenSCG-928-L07]MDL2239250.1 gliding motility-associated C-terminal domain-containing protein [Bacteroidales bacterium OttesenSCG-928-L14]MDL2242384.1 gliding motility-associated C-terminal domain-containing protein [Bacteroidales bacterium OttesenSCG-928-K03]